MKKSSRCTLETISILVLAACATPGHYGEMLSTSSQPGEERLQRDVTFNAVASIVKANGNPDYLLVSADSRNLFLFYLASDRMYSLDKQSMLSSVSVSETSGIPDNFLMQFSAEDQRRLLAAREHKSLTLANQCQKITDSDLIGLFKKLNLEKGETETSAAFKARVAQAISGCYSYMTAVNIGAYDADTQTLNISATIHWFPEGEIRTRNVDVSGREFDSFSCPKLITHLPSTIAQNAFGAQVAVESSVEHRFTLVFVNSNKVQRANQNELPMFIRQVHVERQNLEAFKRNPNYALRITFSPVILENLSSPYSIQEQLHDATLSEPYSTLYEYESISVNLLDAQVIDLSKGSAQ